jgi:hypothetical protein
LGYQARAWSDLEGTSRRTKAATLDECLVDDFWIVRSPGAIAGRIESEESSALLAV